MTFGEFAAAQPPAVMSMVAASMLSFAESSGTRRQAVDNINNESRVSEACWRQLVDAVVTSVGPTDLHRKLIGAFRAHVLEAQAVATPVIRFTRVISTRRYASILSDRLSVSETTAQHLVTTLVAAGPDELNESALLVPWEEDRVVWVTFSATDTTASAFSAAVTADEIRGILGLNAGDRGEPILVFEYTVPMAVAILFPTVAEAYAGDGWQVFFRPAPPGARHGLTMTWPDFAEMPPRPEAVHRPFGGGSFVAALREVI